jgi:hypothetical protein
MYIRGNAEPLGWAAHYVRAEEHRRRLEEAVMNQLIETGRRNFLSGSVALAVSVLWAPMCSRADETASAEEQDLAAVQDMWVRKAGPDAYGDVRRATKDIKGSREVVIFMMEPTTFCEPIRWISSSNRAAT